MKQILSQVHDHIVPVPSKELGTKTPKDHIFLMRLEIACAVQRFSLYLPSINASHNEVSIDSCTTLYVVHHNQRFEWPHCHPFEHKISYRSTEGRPLLLF